MAWLQHEADLHALARALLENETLNAKEIRQILSHPLEQSDEVATVSMMQSWPDKEDFVVLKVQTGTTTHSGQVDICVFLVLVGFLWCNC